MGRIAALSVAVLGLGMASCATSPPPAAIALPNGYYMEHDKASQARIVKRGGKVVVPGPIAAYGVHRALVVGAVGEWAPKEGGYPNASPYKGTPDSRYFLLDTTSGTVDKGLQEDDWRIRMGQRGVPASFDIRAPLL